METEILPGAFSRAERDAAMPESLTWGNKTIRNATALVRERLYQRAQKCGEDLQLMLTICGLALRLRYRPSLACAAALGGAGQARPVSVSRPVRAQRRDAVFAVGR